MQKRVIYSLVILAVLKVLFGSLILCSLAQSDCAVNETDGRLFTTSMNPKVLNAEYAVRGEVLLRAQELDKEK